MDNTVENQIISLVEGFINTMIEMHNCDPEEEERLYGIAEGQLLELTDKALFLLGGREEYLETMLSQLISQKLPQGAVIDCFGNFKEELDQVVARTLEVYHRQQRGLSDDIEDEFDIDDKPEIEETDDIYDEFSGDDDLDEEIGDDLDESDDGSIEETETVIDGTVILEGDISPEDDLGDEELSEDSEASDEDRAVAADDSGDDYDSEEDYEETDFEDGDAEDDATSDSEAVDEEQEEQPEEEPEAEEDDPLGRLVRLMFPGKEIIKNYSIYDILLDYFVPDLDLAFIDAGDETTFSSFGELALRKAGIAVVKVDPSGIYNVKSFKRQLRRTLSEKNLEEKRVFDLSAE